MRRSVVAMMVLVLMMLVLVLAQADDHETFSPKTLLPILIPSAAPAQADHETSSRKTLVPIIPRPAASISQETPSSTNDCDTKCSAECSLAKRFPKHYAACIDHCKKLHCKYTPSYAILKCTITCVDSISPKLASDADRHKVLNEDHIMKACYNGCKKKNNV